MLDFLEIKIFQLTKYLIQRGYSRYGCEDYDENCIVCRAGKAQVFIDEHIDLIRYK